MIAKSPSQASKHRTKKFLCYLQKRLVFLSGVKYNSLMLQNDSQTFSVVLRAESAGGHFLASHIVDSTSRRGAAIKAACFLRHWDANVVVRKTRLENYDYWVVVEERDVESWKESKKGNL